MTDNVMVPRELVERAIAHSQKLAPKKWKCRDGRVLDIKDMETRHLRNTIAMLRRNGVVTTDEYMSCLAYACSSDTPDGAAMCAESEVASMRPWTGLKIMEEELERRTQ